MNGFRWVPLILILAGPGCAITFHEQVPHDDEFVSAKKKESFADLISAPGQRVAMSSTPTPIEGPIPQQPPTPIVVPNLETRPPGTLPSSIPPIPSKGPDEQTKTEVTPLVTPFLQPRTEPDTPFLAAARAFQNGRPDYGQDQLRALPTATQDILTRLLGAAAKTAVGNLNDPKEAGEILTRIDSAAELLRSRTDLKIDVLRMCSIVVAYGEYTPITNTSAMRPGQLVRLYSEIKGTVPEVMAVNGEPQYDIRFNVTVRIRGNGTSSEKSSPFHQPTRSPVRDVYVPLNFAIPSQPGYYTVEMEITDTAGRRAKRSIDFRVDDRK